MKIERVMDKNLYSQTTPKLTSEFLSYVKMLCVRIHVPIYLLV